MLKSFSSRYVKIRRYMFILCGAFLLVFLLRCAYEVYFSGNDIIMNYGYSNGELYFESSMGRQMSNVASAKITQQDNSGQNITIDQKYEKTANLSAVTSDFQQDNQQLRTSIENCEAVIQMENLRGLPGDRLLSVTVGVMPQRFDELVGYMQELGTLKSFTVNKVDKTSEFNYLLAEVETLKMTRDAYASIKEKGGNIQDLLLLEEKILEVEKSMQELGVNLGAYASENSFCTVNLTLQESLSQQLSIRFLLTCAKNSFFWTLAAFALVMICVFGLMAAVAVILAVSIFIRKNIQAEEVSETPAGPAASEQDSNTH